MIRSRPTVPPPLKGAWLPKFGLTFLGLLVILNKYTYPQNFVKKIRFSPPGKMEL